VWCREGGFNVYREVIYIKNGHHLMPHVGDRGYIKTVGKMKERYKASRGTRETVGQYAPSRSAPDPPH
jgi:hypothetical protein